MVDEHRTVQRLAQENEDLRRTLAEANETLEAIRAGDVDALVVSGPEGERIYTLEGAEHGYRVLVEQMDEGAATLAHDGTIRYANQRLAEMVQLPLERLIGSPLSEHVAETDGWLLRSLLEQATGEKAAARGELVLRAADGTSVPAQLTLSRLDNGMPGIAMVATDLTRQKDAERILASEERFRLIAENMSQFAWMADEKGWLFWYNKRWYDYTGTTLEEMQGWGWQKVHHPDHVQRVTEKVRHCFETGEVWEDLFPLRGKDGGYRWFLSRAVPIRDEAGRVVRWFGTNTDVTEQREAEERLRELNATLETRVAERTAVAERRAAQLRALAAELTQAEQRERRRLATVLHDHLQQLLVGMKFSISMLRTHIDGEAGRQVLGQLDDLLNQSIDTSRSLTIDLSPPILHQGTMAEVLHWLAGWFASKHGLRVEVRADDGAPSPPEQLRVLLFQATRELLFNIVKHAGVDRAEVEMDRLGDGRIRVTVGDEGLGFDPSQAKESSGAGGFGLFSLRERIELVGGQLEIDSVSRGGTRVTLIVPTELSQAQSRGAAAALAETLPAAVREPEAAAEVEERVIRVLLADDHQVMRDGLARLLQIQGGIEVVGQAADGLQAVDLAMRLRPDIVVMDVSMPHLDGIEATRRIRDHLPDTQVIGLSMFSEASVASSMKAAGAAAYLAKTSGPECLVLAVREHGHAGSEGLA